MIRNDCDWNIKVKWTDNCFKPKSDIFFTSELTQAKKYL